MNYISEENTQKINNELKPGEIITWTGQPDANKYAKASFISVLFFIPWTAFSIFWMAGASGFKLPDFSNGGFAFFPLFGLPFLFIGLWGLSLPIRMKRNAQSIIYVVTNQRIMIIEGIKSISYKSYFPNQITNIEKVINSDNSGNIYFSNVNYADSDGDSRSRKIGFIGINDVNAIEDKIKKLLIKNT